LRGGPIEAALLAATGAANARADAQLSTLPNSLE
jgi:hypothetical protein